MSSSGTTQQVDPRVIVLTKDEYKQDRKHGYAGPIAERNAETRAAWEPMGATHWVLVNENGGTALAPAVIGRAA